jgi:4a-hydroxytetrahydrobiopterin dehydratase
VAEQGELLPERQVLKREIGAGSERSSRGSQESEYEGHCAQRRSASSRRPVSRSSFGKRQVEIWTHKIDGLTESDFIFAAKCESLRPSGSGRWRGCCV